MRSFIFALATAVAIFSSQAQAAIFQQNYTMTGDVGQGTMSLSYDDSVPYDVNASIYSVTDFNLHVTSNDLTFSAPTVTNIAPGVIQIREGCTGGLCTNFGFQIRPSLLSQVSTLSTHTLGIAASGSLTVTQVSAAVPEPSTWAIMSVGFGAIGASMRQRKRRLLAVA